MRQHITRTYHHLAHLLYSLRNTEAFYIVNINVYAIFYIKRATYNIVRLCMGEVIIIGRISRHLPRHEGAEAPRPPGAPRPTHPADRCPQKTRPHKNYNNNESNFSVCLFGKLWDLKNKKKLVWNYFFYIYFSGKKILVFDLLIKYNILLPL